MMMMTTTTTTAATTTTCRTTNVTVQSQWIIAFLFKKQQRIFSFGGCDVQEVVARWMTRRKCTDGTKWLTVAAKRQKCRREVGGRIMKVVAIILGGCCRPRTFGWNRWQRTAHWCQREAYYRRRGHGHRSPSCVVFLQLPASARVNGPSGSTQSVSTAGDQLFAATRLIIGLLAIASADLVESCRVACSLACEKSYMRTVAMNNNYYLRLP